MRRTLIILAAAAFACGVSLAGDYHYGQTLVCSDCHVMHAQLSHSYSGGTAGYPVNYTPSEYLLKGGINATCLVCHDNDSAIDVVGNASAPPTNGRAAGAINDVRTIGEGYLSYMGHTLDSMDDAPGDSGVYTPGAEGLECINCHSQHGRVYTGAKDVKGNNIANPGTVPGGAFRNLLPAEASSPYTQISYAAGSNNLDVDVFETSTMQYDQNNVNFNEPVTTESGVAKFCSRCHGNFHGTANVGAGPSEFIRHPSAGVNIGAVGGGHSSASTFNATLHRVRVMSPTGNWGTQGTAITPALADLTPTCLSCHKAHGNQRAFGLMYALGNAPLGENGDGTSARHLCRQCHVQGAD